MDSVWIFGDQLSHAHPGLAAAELRGDRVVLMIESKARGSYLRYHQQKLVLIYSAMRHFAEELRAAGWEVDYHRLEETPTFESALKRHIARYQPEGFLLAEPNDFTMAEFAHKVGRKFKLPLEFLPTTQFLLPREEFSHWAGRRSRLVMENHYREMRKRTGYLMEADRRPTGGAWNFDVENRHTFREWEEAGKPRASADLREEPDQITREVIRVVGKLFSKHPGRADGFWLPVDRAGALRWLARFIDERVECFGPYEDIMATDEVVFFHSVLSPMLNIGLLSPQECCEAVLAAFEQGRAPLYSVEGFIRQVIGWREFVNGVYWHRGPDYKTLNALGANRPLPPWFATGETQMNCLHHAIRTALDKAWNNHIQRLMVLGNFMLLAAVRPEDALRWFLEMTADAYDWVMAPNVLGIVLHADGGYLATKPYAATAAYINKMSDYCRGCRYRADLKTGPGACPYNYLYWNFIDQHQERFSDNQRMKMPVNAWAKRSEQEREEIRRSAEAFLSEYVPLGVSDKPRETAQSGGRKGK